MEKILSLSGAKFSWTNNFTYYNPSQYIPNFITEPGQCECCQMTGRVKAEGLDFRCYTEEPHEMVANGERPTQVLSAGSVYAGLSGHENTVFVMLEFGRFIS
jgi:hypothetical protein